MSISILYQVTLAIHYLYNQILLLCDHCDLLQHKSFVLYDYNKFHLICPMSLVQNFHELAIITDADGTEIYLMAMEKHGFLPTAISIQF